MDFNSPQWVQWVYRLLKRSLPPHLLELLLANDGPYSV